MLKSTLGYIIALHLLNAEFSVWCVLPLVEVGGGGKWWLAHTHPIVRGLPTQPKPPTTPQLLKLGEEHLLGGGAQSH